MITLVTGIIAHLQSNVESLLELMELNLNARLKYQKLLHLFFHLKKILHVGKSCFYHTRELFCLRFSVGFQFFGLSG